MRDDIREVQHIDKWFPDWYGILTSILGTQVQKALGIQEWIAQGQGICDRTIMSPSYVVGIASKY